MCVCVNVKHAADKFWKLLGGNIADDGSGMNRKKRIDVIFDLNT